MVTEDAQGVKGRQVVLPFQLSKDNRRNSANAGMMK
jgi:hypothetical protein